MKIGIVNISIGNVGSVHSALRFYNYDVGLVNKPEELKNYTVLILAGVGHFKTAASRIKELHFWDALGEEVIGKKKPVLGICLGMQLFAGTGYEGGENDGLGWINGKVIKIEEAALKVPHMGWADIQPLDERLFRGMRYNSFYFMHSYHFIPDDKNVIKAVTQYGDIEIVAAVSKDNIFGVQFHPEKSQGDGLRFLRNFLEMII
jgi:glutamine amidotransferase